LVIEVPDHERDPFNLLRVREGLPSYSDVNYRVEFDAQHLRECCERAGWSVRSLESRAGTLLAVADAEHQEAPGKTETASVDRSEPTRTPRSP
jgi:hypothetical protein